MKDKKEVLTYIEDCCKELRLPAIRQTFQEDIKEAKCADSEPPARSFRAIDPLL